MRSAVGITLAVALVVLPFPGFMLLRRHSEIVGALGAAGTVSAAVAAALAALAAMRAATDSGKTATQAREALARSVRPQVYAIVNVSGGSGAIGVAQGHIASSAGDAVDVTSEWHIRGRPPVHASLSRLQGYHSYLPPQADIAFYVNLGELPVDSWADEVTHVRVTYWDERRVARWESTFQGQPSLGTMMGQSLREIETRIIG